MTDLAQWRWGTGCPRVLTARFTSVEQGRLRFVRWLVATGRLSERLPAARTPRLARPANADPSPAR
jgi:hypothetical protein